MSTRAQGIRPSQFVTTYGPGALLEGVGGPRAIQCLEDSNLFTIARVEDFEIIDLSLQQVLEGHARIFRLPTNADLHKPEQEAIYSTQPFPKWSLCVRHGSIYQHKVKTTRSCPHCPAHEDTYQAYYASRMEAISLVLACPSGHLHDVDWLGLVHKGKDCKPRHLLWVAQGGSLRNVEIRCPDCSAQANLGEHYMKDHLCPGRFVESSNFSQCRSKARIVQRGATNLFMPEVLSSITIPRRDNPLVTALGHESLVNLLPFLKDEEGRLDAVRLKAGLKQLRMPEDFRQLLLEADSQALQEAARSTQELVASLTPEQARLLEFRELKQAVECGYKDQSPNAPAWASNAFEVDPGLARRLHLPPFQLRVTPILRLRVVSVQAGYRRLGGSLVSSAMKMQNTLWYPGVELLGEGIFLDFAEPPPVLTGKTWKHWAQLHARSAYPQHQPGFVWWHTLAHRLIRAVAVHSGYSSASVRERCYSTFDPATMQWDGGLLLYATQPGGDGTLGGLIAMVERFEKILAQALEYLDNCSNDPFCEETPHSNPEGGPLASGPACYACCLLSETSCENRNSSLDRLLLKETLL